MKIDEHLIFTDAEIKRFNELLAIETMTPAENKEYGVLSMKIEVYHSEHAE